MERQLATVPEWRIFEGIQRLFAADIPWRLVDAKRSDPIHAGAVKIDVKNTTEKFRFEMKYPLPDLANQDISANTFDLCFRDLSNLLKFLESLVIDQVIASAEELAGQRDSEEKDEHAPPESTVKFGDLFWRWLGSPAADPPPSPKLPNPPVATTESNEAPPPHPLYQKLQALKTVAENSRCQRDPMVNSYRRFLKLDHTFQEFTTGLSAAEDLNMRLEGINQLLSKVPFKKSPMKAVPKTRWESGVPWAMLQRLFRILGDSSCGQHHARLRLNGFQLDECSNGSLPIRMFMSSCPTRTYWQNCRCISMLSNVNTTQDRPQALSDICEYIKRFADYEQAQMLRIGFTERLLIYLPNHDEIATCVGDSPMVSFQEILDEGLLRTPGGMLTEDDKAVLALSLARCLLHLVRGPWAQQPWTRRDVQFLGKVDDVRDIWHPYITCHVDKRTTAPTAAEANIVPLFLSFAQLLVELETGERVTADPCDVDFEDAIATIQEQQIVQFGRTHYNNAIRGCFQVKGAELQAKTQASESVKDSRYLLRQAIYDTVVSHLENNFLLISSRSMDDIRCRLSQGKRVTRSGIPLPLVGQGNEAASQIPQRAASASASGPVTSARANSEITQVGTDSRQSGNDDYNVPDEKFNADPKDAPPHRVVRAETPSSMFFDGEGSKEEKHIGFAQRFFDSFDEFRQRYLVRSSCDEGKAQPRVRIAILDTGIRKDDLSNRIQYALLVRKQSNCPKKDRYPIKDIKNFTGNNDPEEDTCGHGTHVASILLRLAPDADLYVAKVSTKASFDNPDGIIRAIKWATEEWKADIINMSFGSKLWDSDITEAILMAKKEKPTMLFFAAASNFGKNEPWTYPASDPNVIAVYALDGHGNDSGGTNPSPKEGHDNFGTLGLGIPVMWDGNTIYKSGSSFASPTAAAIAANVIDWLYNMRQRGSFTETQYQFLRQLDGIRLIFKRQGVKDGHLLSIAPWTLFKQHEGEKDPDSVVCGVLKDKIPSFRPKKETST
ncbi:hypothetical protein CDV36_010102 [Fusarium kuroshium]|uniref:Uncharacterized protein n=1 Tax=Fusarium kuroshium TaxID=2010991 RepID=A0A3M2RY86_9HYPO|nr:hypothetical protein CDV36_010102 [Fusarium kuroshium]